MLSYIVTNHLIVFLRITRLIVRQIATHLTVRRVRIHIILIILLQINNFDWRSHTNLYYTNPYTNHIIAATPRRGNTSLPKPLLATTAQFRCPSDASQELGQTNYETMPYVGG